MADFSINDEQFQKVIAQHILESISQERKDQLVSEALGFLMQPSQGLYGRRDGPSPLANAFRDEVIVVAKDVVAKVIGEDAIRQMIENTIEREVKNWVKSENYDISNVIANAVRGSLEININSNN
ncbi:hypothetical protein PBI_COUNT_64 [Microbacterium phage Count]|nr:hypothetical protein PBI_COUNT_64 [Microbacterium phage Count]